jgi:hypothetical protein
MTDIDSNSKAAATCPVRIVSFITGGDSVYSLTAMTPKAISTQSVNAPQQGAYLYNYGTEQS